MPSQRKITQDLYPIHLCGGKGERELTRRCLSTCPSPLAGTRGDVCVCPCARLRFHWSGGGEEARLAVLACGGEAPLPFASLPFKKGGSHWMGSHLSFFCFEFPHPAKHAEQRAILPIPKAKPIRASRAAADLGSSMTSPDAVAWGSEGACRQAPLPLSLTASFYSPDWRGRTQPSRARNVL